MTTTWFTVDIRYTEDREKLLAVRPAHREFLRRLVERGIVVASGPWADDFGGLTVYRVRDRAELDALLARDPYSIESVFTERTVREWTILLGPLAE